ncbi:hypothetical protein OG871_39855 (plasmid) [Kitasatospora sp. NBC_00374]|uniref:hypothetical protein n=1 Tax=Kitasatospora sp. NBC_00374 TaxID=2975964 RepID=UPI002F90BBE4
MNNHTPTTTEPTQPTHAVAAAPAAGRRTLRAAARARWAKATAPGTFLDRRREDLVEALDHGWRGSARWVRILAGVLIAAFVLYGSVALYSIAHHVLAQSGENARIVGITDSITGPVRLYLDQHTAGLPISGADTYIVWKATGVLTALLSFLLGSAVPRLAWTSWSAATLATVWQASPDSGRTVATALTAAALAAVSIPALRGLSFSLRPQVTIHRTVVRKVPVTGRPARSRAAVPSPRTPFDMS